MTEAPTRAVLAALGGTARFVGGAVRDALLGRAIGDVDLATPLEPEEVIRRLLAAAIKVVPTGLAHGTVTAVVRPRHFEITTLRRDVESFGRHARVAFTDDLANARELAAAQPLVGGQHVGQQHREERRGRIDDRGESAREAVALAHAAAAVRIGGTGPGAIGDASEIASRARSLS